MVLKNCPHVGGCPWPVIVFAAWRGRRSNPSSTSSTSNWDTTPGNVTATYGSSNTGWSGYCTEVGVRLTLSGTAAPVAPPVGCVSFMSVRRNQRSCALPSCVKICIHLSASRPRLAPLMKRHLLSAPLSPPLPPGSVRPVSRRRFERQLLANNSAAICSRRISTQPPAGMFADRNSSRENVWSQNLLESVASWMRWHRFGLSPKIVILPWKMSHLAFSLLVNHPGEELTRVYLQVHIGVTHSGVALPAPFRPRLLSRPLSLN